MQQALAALEWPKVLQLVASFAKTEAGKALVAATVPHFDHRAAHAYQLCQELWAFIAERGSLPLEGLEAGKLLGADAPSWSARELVRLVHLLRTIEEIRGSLLAGSPGPTLAGLVFRLPQLGGFLQWCERRLDQEGNIPDSASPTLAQARSARERLREQLATQLESLARQFPFASGPYTLRRERYCLPIPASERARISGLVLDTSGSGATVFVEPFALVELNNQLSEVCSRIREEEERILGELATAFRQRRGELLAACQVLAELDAFQARVLFARATGAVLLPPGKGEQLRLVGARHPLLDPSLAPLRAAVLGEAGNRQGVVPTELVFPPGVRLLLISGPNAGGKTVALKTLGLTVAQAFSAIPVLAGEDSTLPELDGLFCHIGDEQDVLAERSTFQAAMIETAQLLARKEKHLLVLYDELGSGTDPEEGQALGAAVLEELARREWWTVATTHLMSLASHVENLPNGANAAMGFDEVTGRPTFRLALGHPGRSRGLALARACGLPESVLARAEALVSPALRHVDRLLARLEAEADGLREQQATLARRAAELEEAKKAFEEQERALAQEKERLEQALRQELVKIRQQAQERWAKVERELAEAREKGLALGRRRLAALRSQALSLPAGSESEGEWEAGLKPGETVRVLGFPGLGQVLAVSEGKAQVAIAGKKLWVASGACRPAATSPARAEVEVQAREGTQELVLLGLDREQAREQLEKFLDAALLSGIRHLRIVHGHGTGALRRLVWEVLRGFPGVARFQHPPQYRGGTGVTEVELES